MTVPATIELVQEPSARSDAAYATAVDPSSVADGHPARERHLYAPGELVSLWDMLRIYAQEFIALLKIYARIEALVDNSDMVYADLQNPSRQEKAREGLTTAACNMLDTMQPICERLELKYTLCKIGRMREQFGDKAQKLSILHASVKDLGDLVDDELKDRMFMFVPTDQARFLAQESPPFGEPVREKFPGVTGDVMDASRCLGVGCPTAAVYHLMRVVEFGIRKLSKRLKLPKGLENRPWGIILQAANGAIQALPYTTTRERGRRDRYSEATAHLNNVKDAWRNPTMHSKRRYNQEEAEAIYANVRTFMIYLADKAF